MRACLSLPFRLCDFSRCETIRKKDYMYCSLLTSFPALITQDRYCASLSVQTSTLTRDLVIEFGTVFASIQVTNAVDLDFHIEFPAH